MAAPSSFITDGLNGPSSNLPIILCLHGGGTNATILNVQTMRLQRALLKSFRFAFIDGPLESAPGPGVLPMFEGCGPYLRWLRPEENISNVPLETRKVIERAGLEIGGDVVGVLGFSQGAKLGAGLLWEQEFRRRKSPDGLARGVGDGFNFKFGVFTNSVSPPMTVNLVESELKDNLIEIPSIHVVGTQDSWAVSGRELFDRYFNKSTAKKLEFNIGHRLSTEEAETAQVAAEILRLYKETCG